MNSPTMSQWLQYWQPRPRARLRLFCFPYAGGGASIFRTWSDYLPPEIEVCPVQLPGRENRLLENAFSNIPSLLEPLAQALQPHFSMPFAFFGHSMGALISFEFARYLRRELHLQPAHLFVSGHRAPHLPDPGPPTHYLPTDAFIEELRRLKGTPEEVLGDNELLHLLLPLLRADFELCETYTYKQESALACPITAFGGLHDEEAPRDSVAAWNKQTSEAFKLRFFVGGHFFLHNAQKTLFSAIMQDLLATQH